MALFLTRVTTTVSDDLEIQQQRERFLLWTGFIGLLEILHLYPELQRRPCQPGSPCPAVETTGVDDGSCFLGVLRGSPITHPGPGTLASHRCTLMRVPVPLPPKAAAHTRFLSENPHWLRLLVPLVSLELFFQEHNVH